MLGRVEREKPGEKEAVAALGLVTLSVTETSCCLQTHWIALSRGQEEEKTIVGSGVATWQDWHGPPENPQSFSREQERRERDEKHRRN